MARTQDSHRGMMPRPRTTWRERLFVLGGFAVAAPYTVTAAVLGTGMEAAGPLWLAAVLWTVPSSLALALRRGLRDRDWSAFGRCELPDDRDERMDWVSKTGRYAHLRDWEDAVLRDDRHLR